MDESLLKRFVRSFSTGDVVFQEGQSGNSLFLITKGKLELLHKSNGAPFVIGWVLEGEVLGEKAVLGEGSYRRAFTAKAIVETQALEFDAASLKVLLEKQPDFALRLLRIMSKRLDRLNALVKALQKISAADRVTHYLAYLATHYGTRTNRGMQFVIAAPDVSRMTGVSETAVNLALKQLEQKKILAKENEQWILADENALLQYTGNLTAILAAA